MRWWLLASLVLLAPSAAARPPDATDAPLLERAAQALTRKATTEAIDTFELLADQGVQHPDISYDRGVAYLLRSGSSSARPTDLGRAAAAFHEVLRLRQKDKDAAAWLARTNDELSKARSRRGDSSLLARPRLMRAILGLVDENTWAVLASVGSVLTATMLLVRLFVRHARTRLAGSIAGSLGLVLLLLAGLLTYLAARERRTTRAAVVVATEAPLLAQTGKPLARGHKAAEDAVIPMGALITVLGTEGGLSRVEWGEVTAWVEPQQLQLLPR